MAHIRQSRPESGLGFQVKVLSALGIVLLQGPEGALFLMSEVPLQLFLTKVDLPFLKLTC